MKKTLIILAIIIICGISNKVKTAQAVVIPDKSLRVRVVANSNNVNDQKIKTQVKEAIELKLTELLENAQTLEETKNIIIDNFHKIDDILSSILDPLNILYKIDFGLHYFPTKIFKGVIYEAGNYDSLVIMIGEGKGDNWWCVLFPPLCLLEDNDTVSDVEYQLFISRIINYFK